MNNIIKTGILALLCPLFSGCKTSEITKLYDSIHVATVEDSSGFESKVKITKEAFAKAISFCEKQNKKFLYISEQTDGVEGWTPTSATVKFRCEDPAALSAENNKINEKDSKDAISNLNKAPIHKKLDPENVKIKNKNQNAVAIIIGIQNYKRLGKAEFASQDAKIFYEYAHRVLGISKDQVKILTDADADQAAFLKTFRNWLPLHVTKDQTEVFVFYSGHGLPSPDSKSLYLLPHGVDQDLLHETGACK